MMNDTLYSSSHVLTAMSNELVLNILTRLTPFDLAKVRQSNKFLRDMVDVAAMSLIRRSDVRDAERHLQWSPDGGFFRYFTLFFSYHGIHDTGLYESRGEIEPFIWKYSLSQDYAVQGDHPARLGMIHIATTMRSILIHYRHGRSPYTYRRPLRAEVRQMQQVLPQATEFTVENADEWLDSLANNGFDGIISRSVGLDTTNIRVFQGDTKLLQTKLRMESHRTRSTQLQLLADANLTNRISEIMTQDKGTVELLEAAQIWDRMTWL